MIVKGAIFLLINVEIQAKTDFFLNCCEYFKPIIQATGNSGCLWGRRAGGQM